MGLENTISCTGYCDRVQPLSINGRFRVTVLRIGLYEGVYEALQL